METKVKKPYNKFYEKYRETILENTKRTSKKKTAERHRIRDELIIQNYLKSLINKI